jgi:sugar phosphate isomerase/epimerase
MIRLSAFADEISADIDEQISILQSEGIRFVDLRSMWGINVLDLTDEQVQTIKATLDKHKIGVAAIGSPIGKVAIDGSFREHLQRFLHAIELAKVFQTSFIRVFSFYPPPTNTEAESVEITTEDDADDEWRNEALKRLYIMTAHAREAGITLLHENEKGIYGDTIAHCVGIQNTINDPLLQAAFDPANFIQCGQTPYPDAYDALHPWLRYVHVKDALADGSVVAAGEGAAHWPELLQRLRQDGYDGFFSLEPHLAAAGQFQGFSGPDLFKHASQALQKMLRAMQ